MKKLIMYSSLFIFHFSFFTLKAQSKWSPRASLPDSTRDGAIGFSIGNYGYIGLGTHNAHVNYPCLDDFWQFNASTDSWMQKANFPGKARICPATFVIGHYAYVVTGQENDSSSPKYTSECWQYNADNNIWTQKANFPGAPRAYDVGFAIGGKGYVGIGSDYYKHYCKDFWEYDTVTNAWARIADFGGDARLASSGFAVAAKGYVCFGWDSAQKWHKDLWQYDTTTKIWVQKSNYPGYPTYAASGFVIGTNIYLGCTQDSTRLLDDKFWQYSTTSDKWTEQATFPGHLRTSCSAFAIGDTGYLGLGVSYDSIPAIYFNDLHRFLYDSTLGIIAMDDKTTFTVYPNPVSQTLYINFDKQFIGLATLSIMDIAGREIFNSHFTIQNSQLATNVSSLSPGMYFINIKTKDLYAIQKFIKQ